MWHGKKMAKQTNFYFFRQDTFCASHESEKHKS